MEFLHGIGAVLAVGLGATAFLDAWLLALGRLGVPVLDFGLLGRWIGHLGRGRVRHAAIARATPIPGETAIGWLGHYAVGIAFAAGLAGWQGEAWLRAPTPGPALAFGLATAAAPLFVMQPAMGAGWASSRTATPVRNVLRSLANHLVFGLGLYLAAQACSGMSA